ncbi:purine nucleoside permease [Roridomyces roridus]|uniref:Purine nucleoside permease n=1 Tax=Roridomyces roridus TaxID=1738132 RepID=A0AAD7BZ96_9AGAR|nr:purine nucleoside permease [Roridomyces roridus]
MLSWLLFPLLSSLVLDVRGANVTTIKPRLFIVTMFDLESDAWYNIPDFNILAQNITVPGFSPLYPNASCTSDASVCLLTTGEGEINAASTITSLLFSPSFDLTSTYFMISGTAGINPKMASIGDVTFARYSVSVALQYEFDTREMPSNFNTGYFPIGSTAPGGPVVQTYGTEVFEVNDALRQLAFSYAKTATLNDTAETQLARNMYVNSSMYTAAARQGPSVVLCDTATSDVWWSGQRLGEAFENITRVWTNGTGEYCTSQQEDNATLNALMRGALFRLVDFSRIIVMRSGSDFDRQYEGQAAVANLLGPTPGFSPSVLNLRLAGVKIIEAILDQWDSTFAKGIEPTNYVGDILGSLGGEPDFGPGSVFKGKGAVMGPASKRVPGKY